MSEKAKTTRPGPGRQENRRRDRHHGGGWITKGVVDQNGGVDVLKQKEKRGAPSTAKIPVANRVAGGGQTLLGKAN